MKEYFKIAENQIFHFQMIKIYSEVLPINNLQFYVFV